MKRDSAETVRDFRPHCSKDTRSSVPASEDAGGDTASDRLWMIKVWPLRFSCGFGLGSSPSSAAPARLRFIATDYATPWNSSKRPHGFRASGSAGGALLAQPIPVPARRL
jgi:hypothetical protein